MLRYNLKCPWQLVAILFVLAWAGDVSAARKLHVLVIGDDKDPTIGKHVSHDTENITQMIRGNVAAHERVIVRQSNNQLVAPMQRDILAAIARLNTKPEDAVLFYYSGHGVYGKDEKHNLVTQNGKEFIPRQAILEALQKKGCGLTAIITDCCFNFSPQPPKPQVKDAFDDPKVTAPLFQKLFFQTNGLIDVNSAKKGQVAGTYVDDSMGSIFTQAFRNCLNHHRDEGSLTWNAVLTQIDTDAAKVFRELYPEGHVVETPTGSVNQRDQRLVKLGFDIKPFVPASGRNNGGGGNTGGINNSGGQDGVGPRSLAARFASVRLGATVQDHPEAGILIIAVANGGPATRCVDNNGETFRLKSGDSIIAMNAVDIVDVTQFSNVIRKAPVVTSLTIIEKNGLVHDYTTGLDPLTFANNSGGNNNGANGGGGGTGNGGNGNAGGNTTGNNGNNTNKGTRFGAQVIKHRNGVRVVSVVPMSPAQRCIDDNGDMWQLVPGDVIRSINGRLVTDEASFRQAVVGSPREMTLEVTDSEQSEFGFTSTLNY